jgi:hypothetical protein
LRWRKSQPPALIFAVEQASNIRCINKALGASKGEIVVPELDLDQEVMIVSAIIVVVLAMAADVLPDAAFTLAWIIFHPATAMLQTIDTHMRRATTAARRLTPTTSTASKST